MTSYDTGPFLSVSAAGTIVLPARPPLALPGDDVTPDGALRSRGAHKGLVGVVDFRSRTSMGRSKAGVPLFLFHPVDPGYPPFIVGSRETPDANWFCTAEFVSWEAGHPWPRGALQVRLGPVGDLATERRAHRLAATVAGADTLVGLVTPEMAAYQNEPWSRVFHIDPEGCEDVDDVLAYKDEADGSTTWLIGIADVAAWIQEGSPLDLLSYRRGQTLYEDGKVVAPMLPPPLSTGLASLRSDGSTRPVIGLRLTVGKDGAVAMGDLGFYQVVVTQTYTYDSVVGTEVGARVGVLSAALGGSSEDAHVWIETVMVAYNVCVARRLKAAGLGLLRRLPASSTPYAAVAKATGYTELEHIGRQAGEYCAASTDEEVGHAALGVSEYCHASSPLRRYADLVNQRVLHHLLRGSAAPAGVSAVPLNHRSAVARRMERDLWFVQHVLRDDDAISETNGVLLEWREGRGTVYCPAWRRVLTATMAATAAEAPPGANGVVRVFVNRADPRLSRRIIASFERATSDRA